MSEAVYSVDQAAYDAGYYFAAPRGLFHRLYVILVEYEEYLEKFGLNALAQLEETLGIDCEGEVKMPLALAARLAVHFEKLYRQGEFDDYMGDEIWAIFDYEMNVALAEARDFRLPRRVTVWNPQAEYPKPVLTQWPELMHSGIDNSDKEHKSS